MDTFGERLNKKIKEKGLTAAELGRQMKLKNRQNVTNWISGKAKPKADDLTLLANHLSVSVDWLLTGVTPYEAPEGTINVVMEEYIEFLNFKNQKLEKENRSLKNNDLATV